ncbi:MAG: hypothetical protein NVS1B11_31660 [Terriglobales bacterium]
MTTGILIAWASALALALVVTLMDVYLLSRVVILSREIRTLTAATLPAAVGIVHNTQAGAALGSTVALIQALKDKTAALDPLTKAVVRKLTGLGG